MDRFLMIKYSEIRMWIKAIADLQANKSRKYPNQIHFSYESTITSGF